MRGSAEMVPDASWSCSAQMYQLFVIKWAVACLSLSLLLLQPTCITANFILRKDVFSPSQSVLLDEFFFFLCDVEVCSLKSIWEGGKDEVPKINFVIVTEPGCFCSEASKPFPNSTVSVRGCSAARQNKNTTAAAIAVSTFLFVPIRCPFFKAKPSTTVNSLSLTLRYLRAKQAAFCSWRLGWVSASQ